MIIYIILAFGCFIKLYFFSIKVYKSEADIGHGIMFHHFHGMGSIDHPRGEGSLSADDFARMIEFIGRDRIIDAKEWFRRALSGGLKKEDIVLTFDDSLLCQIEVAKPVLDSYGIKGAFFIYSSVLEGEIVKLELYRIFRNKYFKNFNDFFDAFMKIDSEFSGKVKEAVKNFPEDYMIEYRCHTREGRMFRYIRDIGLSRAEYEKIMDDFINEYGGLEELGIKRWMGDDDILNLVKEGHVVGMHSYSHPTKMEILSKREQEEEYRKNRDHVERVVGKQDFLVASHPSNSYNTDTLAVLDDLGVEIAFCSNMSKGVVGKFEYPREDHAHVWEIMQKNKI